MQLIQRRRAALCPVMVRFVHNENQIRERGQILIEGVANDLIDLPHRCVFFVELVNVVNEDADIRLKSGDLLGFVIIIRDDLRRRAEAAEATKNILLTVEIGKIPLQFVIDGRVGCDDKKVANVVLRIQVGDECAHQTCFANARGQRKGERHEFPLKVCACRVHGMDCTKSAAQIHALAQRYAA